MLVQTSVFFWYNVYGDYMYIVGQIIGFAYLIFLITSFQFKDKRKLIFVRLCSAITASMHYILIGALTGSLAQLNNALVNVSAPKLLEKKRLTKIIAIIIFSIIYIAIAIFGYNNLTDLLPSIGFILTVIVLLFANTKQIRLAQFSISPLFLVYNIVNHSYAGILAEILVLVSCVMGVIRLDLKKGDNQDGEKTIRKVS